jgi:hypothetical protein
MLYTCTGWPGHGTRPDGPALGVHALAQHRGHVPRGYAAPLREERPPEAAAQATRRQRHRLCRLPRGRQHQAQNDVLVKKVSN